MQVESAARVSGGVGQRLGALWGNRYRVLYAVAAAWLGVRVVSFYNPHTGFTPLLAFGEAFAARRLPQLEDVPIHTERRSDGYDGQFYAQIAVAGNPFDPGLAAALDAPAYRSRRILTPVLAHVVGLGDPRRVLNVYALMNLVAWLLLAVALGRWWFPPTDVHNLLRWVGTLFAAGMIGSVTLGLTDGPALLLVAVGVRCIERGRYGLGAICLGAAGLTRETSVLAGVGGPSLSSGRGGRPSLRDVVAFARFAAVVVLPVVAWVLILRAHYPEGGQGGSTANFALPFGGLARKVREMSAAWRAHGLDLALRIEILATLATLVQVVFFAVRRQAKDPWWRIGAAFAGLSLVLGWAVWEGTPGAMTRVLLPLGLAFNVLVPRTRLGLVLLLGGNLSVLSAPALIEAHATERTALLHGVTYDWGPGWYESEHLGRRTWRWARGSTEIVFYNPTAKTYLVGADFELASVTRRQVVVRARQIEQSVSLEPQLRVFVTFGPFLLPPGETPVTFSATDPPWVETVATGRPLSFSVHDFDPAVFPVSSPATSATPAPATSPSTSSTTSPAESPAISAPALRVPATAAPRQP